MLKHLIKYEWKASSRILLPIFGGTILLALVNRLLSFWIYSEGWLQSFVRSTMATGYSMFVAASFMITFLTLLSRFSKSLLGDEGYLMFTLPVSPSQHIWAKAIVSAIMSMLSVIATVLSVMILEDISLVKALGDFFDAFRIISFHHPHLLAFLAEGVVLTIVGMFAGIFFLYLCIAVGHMVGRYRAGMSFLAYFILSTLLQWAIITTIAAISDWGVLRHVSNEMLIHCFFGIGTAGLLLLGTICFLSTRWILTHRLNLQ